ncbi:MAG: alpha-1,4-glucan--maltose-1-phosphate maltosyltransferase [Spirochaetia bacterium]
MQNDGRRRVIIENVVPRIENGKYPVKRTITEPLQIEADIYADGHDTVKAELVVGNDENTSVVPLTHWENDRWRGETVFTKSGTYFFRIRAWVDHFLTWHSLFRKKVETGMELGLELVNGSILAEEASERARDAGDRKQADRLKAIAGKLRDTGKTEKQRVRTALGNDFLLLGSKYPDRTFAAESHMFPVLVQRELAGFSAWYELFPRSASEEPGKHGTFLDVIKLLPYVAGMGFDVLYLPPIHPIGTTKRKGKNNSLTPEKDDPGSPWAIGSAEGGHKAIHPELGTMKEFNQLAASAADHGLEIALDIAFQCSPDHPWVKKHPEWFIRRPDGSIQYAENPPKKYEDIYPINFESDDWQNLWQELKSVFDFWIDKGVKIFRVDNPHTKAFPFWEWCINEINRTNPDIIFLAEAFTRPKVMYRLAKLGYTQSYTYFAWRNEPWELQEYVEELLSYPVKDFFRPNFWPNTPDILTETLQQGGESAFKMRLILAATLTANYGIYGPAFELQMNTPREEGSEEYLDSEKYEIKDWDLQDKDSLSGYITAVNRIRKEYPVKYSQNTRFHQSDNTSFICYSKHDGPQGDPSEADRIILFAVNMDWRYTQTGWLDFLPPAKFRAQDGSFLVRDVLNGEEYTWKEQWNFIKLDPAEKPAHIFVIEAAK